MSTLKVSAIQNAAAGSGGLVLAADGNVSGAGMDLIVSQSFTAVSTVSIDDCFSADYDNYRIAVSVIGSTTLQDTFYRLRAGGVDDSTASSYSRAGAQLGASTALINSTGTAWAGGYVSSANAVSDVLELQSPFLAETTVGHRIAGREKNYCVITHVTHSVASSFDGFTYYPTSGTVTGTLRVYGYRN